MVARAQRSYCEIYARTELVPAGGYDSRRSGRLKEVGNETLADEYIAAHQYSILVPQSFMEWSNSTYAPDSKSDPTRLIVEVANPADERIAQYMEDNGFATENNNLAAEKTTYFLKLVVTLVMAIGGVISVLSFYILMLSIYLLVQKNASKLQNLLLIGYSPTLVAMPYQLLTIGLNLVVLLIALVVLSLLRGYYMEVIETLFPDIDEGNILPQVQLALCSLP